MKNKPDIILLGNNGALVFESCPEEFKDMFTAYYSEEFMFEFAKWSAKNYMRLTETWIKIQDYGEESPIQIFTTKELLEQFKKSKDGTNKQT